jgi:hypothetical protein
MSCTGCTGYEPTTSSYLEKMVSTGQGGKAYKIAWEGDHVFKEKKEGLKYLFSDKEIRGIAIVAFVLAILLVSVDYLVNIVPLAYVYIIAIASYLVFQYLFLFFLFFNVWRMFGAFSDNRKQRNDKASLWAIRLLAGGLVAMLDFFLLFIVLIPFALLMMISFLTWCALEAFFMCKLAAELASFTQRRGFRFLVYLFIALLFAAYLIISLWIAVGSLPKGSPGSITASIGTSWFDWILTLVLFVFSFASMGERFLAAERMEKLDFGKLSGKQGARIRSNVVFLLFALIGFELIVRGFNFISALLPFSEFGSITYYGVKLFFFIPFSIGFLFAVTMKRISKIPGKE